MKYCTNVIKILLKYGKPNEEPLNSFPSLKSDNCHELLLSPSDFSPVMDLRHMQRHGVVCPQIMILLVESQLVLRDRETQQMHHLTTFIKMVNSYRDHQKGEKNVNIPANKL